MADPHSDSTLPRRNNLADASSPYLRQHRRNPVWWQEWSADLIGRSRAADKPLFVSVGYATCHWCHVMAAEAFSDRGVADALNRDFVSIKIDREERPDIDHFMMQFLLATRGHGGWPLNVFLTPDLKPMVALTYVPVTPRGGMPGFEEILDKVAAFYRERGGELPSFDLWQGRNSEAADEAPAPAHPTPQDFVHVLDNLVRRGDHEWGGFGPDAKFPPHSTLLYMLFGVETYRHDASARLVRRTLDMMAGRGLHDHLQGGFFRYCVDREWTIPHFEKMLYDQAMLLWVYARAAKIFRSDRYRRIALDIVRCLEESFTLPDGTFASAHDADTDHHEGATYVWDIDELREVGTDAVERLFHLPPGGNFEGRYHLILRDGAAIDDETRKTLDTLLARRRRRRQPFRDDKAITSWNALAATALIFASRDIGESSLAERGRALYVALSRRNRLADGRWIRSSLEGRINETEFLEDYAAILLVQTQLVEEARDAEERSAHIREIERTETHIERFRRGNDWAASLNEDAPSVPADDFDSPTPSPRSLVEMALQRSAVLRTQFRATPPLRHEQHGDFGNLATALAAGEVYLLERPVRPDWNSVPTNAIFSPSTVTSWCFRGVCTPGEAPSIWNPAP